jgi:hypothetical protein
MQKPGFSLKKKKLYATPVPHMLEKPFGTVNVADISAQLLHLCLCVCSYSIFWVPFVVLVGKRKNDVNLLCLDFRIAENGCIQAEHLA